MAKKPNAVKNPPKKSVQVLAQMPAEVVPGTDPVPEQTPPVQAGTMEKTEPKTIDLTTPDIKSAIEQGQVLVKDGKSKADAARVIYGLLKDQGKDVVIAAFVAGATLTERGAMTYWYNCKRRAEKEERKTEKS